MVYIKSCYTFNILCFKLSIIANCAIDQWNIFWKLSGPYSPRSSHRPLYPWQQVYHLGPGCYIWQCPKEGCRMPRAGDLVSQWCVALRIYLRRDFQWWYGYIFQNIGYVVYPLNAVLTYMPTWILVNDKMNYDVHFLYDTYMNGCFWLCSLYPVAYALDNCRRYF